MNRSIVWRWLVLLATLVTITMNILANALPFNGLNTGEISDSFDIYFVPAGYVFSIWLLIYLGLLSYSIYQLLPAQRENNALTRITGLYLLSCLFNVAWLICWHYELFPLTIVLMLGLLLSLIGVYLRLNAGKKPVSAGMRWFVQLPFSIYLGWVSVATIANASQLLYYLGWQGGGISPQVWAVIMLGVAVVLAALMALLRTDAGYLLVLVWAFAGIGVAQADTQLVASSAWIAAVIAGGLAIYSAVQSIRNQKVRST